MNVYDSSRMKDSLLPLGYEIADNPQEANLIILNTCHIREKAAEKMYSDLGRYKPYKQEKIDNNQEAYIVVAGCTAQAEGKEIKRRAPYVDIVIGPQTYHLLPELIRKIHLSDKTNKKSYINTNFPVESKFDFLPELSKEQGVSAFLSVQEGCDKMCTFCVVPYTRGAEFSRPVQDIVKEAVFLTEQGVSEITLLGQNVTAYHGKGPDKNEWRLSDLIRQLAQIEGLKRIRYTTSHPRDMKEDILQVHADIDKLMPFLHLPVQSGSDRILKAMNRRHTHQEYRQLIDAFKQARPDIVFSTDIIVGFPGESDKDFEETFSLVQEVGFSQAFSFKYSIRHGTPAGLLHQQIDEAVKDRRLYRLQNLLKKQQEDFNQSMIGKVVPVLFEKKGKYDGQITGRSPYLQPVHIYADPSYIGKIYSIKITQAGYNSLAGEKIDS